MAIRIRNGVKERQQIDGSWEVADSEADQAGKALATTGSVTGTVAGGGTTGSAGPAALGSAAAEGAASLDAALQGLDFSRGEDEGREADAVSEADLVKSLQTGSGGGAVLASEQALREGEVVRVEAVEVVGDVRAQGGQMLTQGDPTPGVEAAVAAGEADASADLWEEIPGLTSDDGRGVQASRKIRDRLKNRGGAKKSPRGRGENAGTRKVAHVRVPMRAAEVSGPATEDTTRVRQNKLATRLRKTAARNGHVTVSKTRYVSSSVPALLKDRARWIQELFEAHFRAESTLAMRRVITGYTADGKPKNRMKLSREDFAIGWLTAFDKFREEPRLLRAREGEALSSAG